MPVVVAVLGAGLSALLVVLLAETLGHGHTAATEPERAERWLVGHLARRRSTHRIVATLDRRVWGGTAVAIGFVAILVAAGVLGWLLDSIDDDRGFARFDRSLAEWGSTHATRVSTDVLRAVTWLGSTWLLVGVMAAVGLFVVWRRPGRHWGVLGFLLTVGIGVSLVNNGLKLLIDRQRPAVTHLADSAGSSFPSGHSAAAAACWAAIALVVSVRLPLGRRRFAAATAAGIAVLVAASRVMLGVHWLTDVIAGVTVGWTWFLVVALAFGGRRQRFGAPAEQINAVTDEVPDTDVTADDSTPAAADDGAHS